MVEAYDEHTTITKAMSPVLKSFVRLFDFTAWTKAKAPSDSPHSNTVLSTLDSDLGHVCLAKGHEKTVTIKSD